MAVSKEISYQERHNWPLSQVHSVYANSLHPDSYLRRRLALRKFQVGLCFYPLLLKVGKMSSPR
jgi:hypothetical protein